MEQSQVLRLGVASPEAIAALFCNERLMCHPNGVRCVASFPRWLQTHSTHFGCGKVGATLNGWKWRHRGIRQEGG